MAINPPDDLTPDKLQRYLERMTSDKASLNEILLAELGVVEFPPAALGMDHFSSEELTGRYRAGFAMEDYTMVLVGGLSGREMYLFGDVDQMDKLRGEFGSNGISGGFAIPNNVWKSISQRINKDDIKDFRPQRDNLESQGESSAGE